MNIFTLFYGTLISEMRYPFVRQHDTMDCGPACLSMVAAWHGKRLSLESIRRRAWITRQGVSLLGLKTAAESIGFRAAGVKISFDKLLEGIPLPAIAHWQQNHFIVVNRVSSKMIWVSDPALGRFRMTHKEFMKGWVSAEEGGEPAGMLLLLEPAQGFTELEEDPPPKGGFSFLTPYLKDYKRQIFWLFAGLVLSSGIQLLFPFLTQAIIDRGIAGKDIKLIWLILAGQLALILGRLLVEFTRGWLLLHMGTRLNIRIVSDFLARLMALPIAYFDTKLDGDILQRIDDNSRVEGYITSSSLAILFSLFNFFVFGIVLGIYSLSILLIFIAGTALYITYVMLFMPARERLENLRFKQMAEATTKMIHMVNGMQEIKLAGNERVNRNEWEQQQQAIYSTRIRGMRILQFQTAGGTLIHESVNIIITVISATLVINGSLTLGMMLAIQFIIGELNGPVSQIISFLRASQDARISLGRLAEIHTMEPEEERAGSSAVPMPARADIEIRNLSFRYEGPGSPWVLKNLNLLLPAGKVTAVVGESGSGKTTLLKMLMGFYPPAEGEIFIGGRRLQEISVSSLRRDSGTVMQEGYIFPDTILGNIAPGDETPDMKRVEEATEIACLKSLIDLLPSGFRTRVGPGGHGLSQGQRQRILIARVVYRQPSLLLLDEATNALDATNERMIVENLAGFYQGRTVVVVAHRLSTVRHADKIVVLEKGRVTESGTHSELTKLKGTYYRLIKDQLELGN